MFPGTEAILDLQTTTTAKLNARANDVPNSLSVSRLGTQMSGGDKLVVALAGHTKSGKTRVAHLLAMYTGGETLELSDGIRDLLPTTHKISSAFELIDIINDLRHLKGSDIIARAAVERALATQSDIVIISGLRSAADYTICAQPSPDYWSFLFTLQPCYDISTCGMILTVLPRLMKSSQPLIFRRLQRT